MLEELEYKINWSTYCFIIICLLLNEYGSPTLIMIYLIFCIHMILGFEDGPDEDRLKEEEWFAKVEVYTQNDSIHVIADGEAFFNIVDTITEVPELKVTALDKYGSSEFSLWERKEFIDRLIDDSIIYYDNNLTFWFDHFTLKESNYKNKYLFFFDWFFISFYTDITVYEDYEDLILKDNYNEILDTSITLKFNKIMDLGLHSEMLYVFFDLHKSDFIDVYISNLYIQKHLNIPSDSIVDNITYNELIDVFKTKNINYYMNIKTTNKIYYFNHINNIKIYSYNNEISYLNLSYLKNLDVIQNSSFFLTNKKKN